ncbi:TonB-dependent receptor [Hymenobacter chitinivorans]|uniref:Iron complex outermembrane receptor protein n=1 Tax=Hymenobacter chitinivorans DSM 11115 TaxID=1121954 RepID=A0A2M9BN39_9BACT|nr:TonB-dependent receptor [Hymenobacter chitinivorans]PJJ59345.1 iron complex outermembrane receptor protein [Hymenobacter chitinivorans DSM 11115]
MKRVIWLAAISVVVVPVSQAQTQSATPADTSRTLPEVQVTYQAERRTPVTFLDLSGRALARKSVGQEPSFLLAETPAITAYSDAGSTQGYAYFRMRGIDQTRINTTLNGVPLNEPEDQGAYFSNYPDLLNSISKVQVQRGVGTSQNGSASFGGSIQLFSPSLRQDSASATVGLGYGSFNSYRAFGEYASGLHGRKALYVRASQLHSDGYKDRSANTSRSVFISGGLFYDKTTWKLNVLAGHQQNQLAWLGVPDSVLAVNRRANVNGPENDRFDQALVQLQNTWQPAAGTVVNTSVYASFLKGNYDFDLNSFLGLPSTAELYNYAFQSGFWGAYTSYSRQLGRLTWTSGLHANTYHRQHTGSEKALGQLYQNTGRKREASAFTKLEYEVQRFTLFADVQGRTVAFEYDGAVPLGKLDWQFFNPKAGVSFAASNHATLYYSLGRTGREPTRNDLFGGSDDLLADADGQALITSPAAEYVLDQELGLRYQRSQLEIGVNGYYMDFKNEIVLNGKFGPNGLALTNNVKSSVRTGLEATARWQASRHWSLLNNSAFNYSRIREQTEEFRPILTPGLILNQEVAYQTGPWAATVAGRYQSRSFVDFANSATIGEYALLNARLEYSSRHYQVTAFANNLTNTKYFNNGSVEADGTRKYFVQAPRNYYLSVQYRF